MSVDSPFADSSDSQGFRRVGAVAVVSLIAAFVLWVGCYATGIFPWIGYAWLDRSSFGAGPITIIGENRAGISLGFNEFLLFAGQEVVIGYDARIEAGSLWFYVYNVYDFKLGDGVTHYVTESGTGEWTTRIERTGVYHITVEPSPVRGKGQGWDLTYVAWWGARPAE
jgi:hypothetical protein